MERALKKTIFKLLKNPFLVRVFIIAKLKQFFSQKTYSGIIGNRSISDDGSYISAITKALKSHRNFMKFKRDSRYRMILEHVTKEDGLKYLNIVKEESPDIYTKIDEFKVNDLIGGTLRFKYPEIGEVSATTLRYIKVASDIRNNFGELTDAKIAEIGVGYGGQLLILDKILDFDRCDLFDLPKVLELTSKYLESHILNSSYHLRTLNQHSHCIEYDLVISNYGFSELPSKLQRMYIKKILSKAKRGYLTMNSGLQNSAFKHDKLTLQELEVLLPEFKIQTEKPLTHEGNYIIIWDLTKL